MMSNNCPAGLYDSEGCEKLGGELSKGDLCDFIFELHCACIKVRARSLGWNDEKQTGEYEIISYEFMENY